MHVKLLSSEAFSAQNAADIAQRPGSARARTRWGSLERSPKPLAGLNFPWLIPPDPY